MKGDYNRYISEYTENELKKEVTEDASKVIMNLQL
jgi:hypothetical protein